MNYKVVKMSGAFQSADSSVGENHCKLKLNIIHSSGASSTQLFKKLPVQHLWGWVKIGRKTEGPVDVDLERFLPPDGPAAQDAVYN